MRDSWDAEGDQRDCGDQWMCTQVKEVGETVGRLRENKETVETSGCTHYNKGRSMRDSWRLSETKDTGKTVETNGYTHK